VLVEVQWNAETLKGGGGYGSYSAFFHARVAVAWWWCGVVGFEVVGLFFFFLGGWAAVGGLMVGGLLAL
jgi:hypothetical protein